VYFQKGSSGLLHAADVVLTCASIFKRKMIRHLLHLKYSESVQSRALQLPSDCRCCHDSITYARFEIDSPMQTLLAGRLQRHQKNINFKLPVGFKSDTKTGRPLFYNIHSHGVIVIVIGFIAMAELQGKEGAGLTRAGGGGGAAALPAATREDGGCVFECSRNTKKFTVTSALYVLLTSGSGNRALR
jgi:hypothetical protein